MTLRGHVKNGVVVLEGDAALADGTPVHVRPVVQSKRRHKGAARLLGRRLLKFAGTAKGLPRDMARNHDHYIHGAPKK